MTMYIWFHDCAISMQLDCNSSDSCQSFGSSTLILCVCYLLIAQSPFNRYYSSHVYLLASLQGNFMNSHTGVR